MKLSPTTAAGETFSCEADFQDSVTAVVDECKKLFEKDAESIALFEWMEQRTAHGAHSASFVWVVGMRQPLRLGLIYQPTRLQMALSRTVIDENGRTWGTLEPQEISVSQFLKDRVNSIVTAGAGFGKSTFMHAIFRRWLRGTPVMPLMLTLLASDEVKPLCGC